MPDELLLALLEADGVHHALPLDALEARLDHRPLGRVEHHRHSADPRLRGDELEEFHHGCLGVEHPFVHVDVDHLRAALHLLARDLQPRLVVAREDQPGELARAGDVGPLADVGEDAVRPDGQRLEPAQPEDALRLGTLARRQAADGVGDRADVRRRRPAAAAHEVDQPVLGELAEHARHELRRLVVLPELVRQARVGMRAHVDRRHPRELLHVLPERPGPQRAVEPHAQRPAVRHRVPERFRRLPGERPPARVHDRAGDHHREPLPDLVEQRLEREQRRLRVERVEDGLDQDQVGPAIDEPARAVGVRGNQLVERHVPEAGVVHVRRKRRASVGGAEDPGHEPRRVGHPALPFVGGVTSQPGRGVVELVDQLLHAVVRERHRVRRERVGLDDVGPGLEVRRVDGPDDPGLGQGEEIAVAPKVAGPVGEALASIVLLAQAVGLDHRSHRAVEHENAPGEKRLEQGKPLLPAQAGGGRCGGEGVIDEHRRSGDEKAPEGQNASGDAF